MSDIVTATLVLQVTVRLAGETPKTLEDHLETVVSHAVGEGLITGETPMEVEEYTSSVLVSDVYTTVKFPEPPEDDDSLDGLEDSEPPEEEEDEPKVLTTGDGTPLRQCTRCGEVVPKNVPCGCPVEADGYDGDDDDDEIPY